MIVLSIILSLSILNRIIEKLTTKQAEEENTGLMKRISQLDQDLDKAQEQLAEVNNKLEEANKKSADVSTIFLTQNTQQKDIYPKPINILFSNFNH